MSFVPCCKCGNISIVAPLHRVMKTFVKRTSAQSQKGSMNISQISSSPFLTHQNSNVINDDDVFEKSHCCLDNKNSEPIHNSENNEYSKITESPVLALTIPQNSIFFREIDQVRFANDHKQFPEIDGQLTVENEPNILCHHEAESANADGNYHNCTSSLVVKSVFMKCSKCGAIFVINFTRRNAYLCRLTSGIIRSSPLKDSIPINVDDSNTFNSQNANNKLPNLPPRASIRSFTSSPFLAQRQVLKNKASMKRNRQMISNFVPVFVMPLICGCGTILESTTAQHDSSNPITHPHPGSAPTVDPTIREKRIKRSNSLGTQKPWSKIASNDDTENPDDDTNNADNNDLFTKTNENNGFIRSKHYGSDGDTFFGADWPDTDFEFMFSAKDDIPFEFKTNIFL